MELPEGYSVVRTVEAGRPPWGRWEVRNVAGVLVGVVAEEPVPGRRGRPSTFTVVHNPSPALFILRFSRRLRAGGAWWSEGHQSVSYAVASLARHLQSTDGGSGRHYMTGSRR
ncbi:MAG TPA: hypothetical protein VFE55_18060 [Acidimicrobiia bacterium]|nr:hypothetical protein [Acidimicrobiia bacterium]